MPIYHGAAVAVSLATVGLADSVTAEPRLLAKDLAALHDAIESNSTALRETPVLDKDNTSPLRFIGSAGDAPFYLTQVVDDNEHGLDEATTKTPTKALLLMVDLSKSYIFSQKTRGSHPQIKIEVFYNGELSACRHLTRNTLNDPLNIACMHVFGGRRFTTHCERPWVLRSHGSSINGGTAQEGETVQYLWDAVNQSLIEEAEKRGKNRWGDFSPTGDYLMSLSTCKLPAAMASQTVSGGPLPGIIDLVISLGHGHKGHTPHHAEPTRMTDRRYGAHQVSTGSKAVPNTDHSPTGSLRPAKINQLRRAERKVQTPEHISAALTSSFSSLEMKDTDSDANRSFLKPILPKPDSETSSTPQIRSTRANADTSLTPLPSMMSNRTGFWRKELAGLLDVEVPEPPKYTAIPDRSDWTTPVSCLTNQPVASRPKLTPASRRPPKPLSTPQRTTTDSEESSVARGGNSSRTSRSSMAKKVDSAVGSFCGSQVGGTPSAFAADSMATPAPPSNPRPKRVSVTLSLGKRCRKKGAKNSATSHPDPGHGNSVVGNGDSSTPSFVESTQLTADVDTHSTVHDTFDDTQVTIDQTLDGKDTDVKMEEAPGVWEPPSISVKSVFTYAAPQMLDHHRVNKQLGVVRQVRKERSGEFEEHSILCGVRYIKL